MAPTWAVLSLFTIIDNINIISLIMDLQATDDVMYLHDKTKQAGNGLSRRHI